MVLPVTIVTAIALLWFWTEVFGSLPPKIAVFAVFCLSSGIGGALAFRCNERFLVSIIRRELVGRGYPLCLHCGYDLTGNTSGVCSECGTPAAAAAEKPGR